MVTDKIAGWGRIVVATLAGGAMAAAAVADRAADAPTYHFDVQVKAHYRDSEHARFPSPFKFPPSFLPPGETQAFLETVDQGSHVELSAVILRLDARFSELWSAALKVDGVDRYDRNPTSSDREVDVDEAWLRFGTETAPGEAVEASSFYAKLGKLGKFERQDDRHLESYGLVSTAFNRMEDVGLEIGGDLGSYFYLRTSFTSGNPLFFRDPNALAGDNGTPLLDGTHPNPLPRLKVGLPIYYDAEVDLDDAEFEEPQVGLGLGVRLGGDLTRVDVLAFVRQRDLQESVDLRGTVYGGDLDLIRGPFNSVPPPALSGDRKREVGASLWLYAGGLAFFGQYVNQEIANLDRRGYEGELSWRFELPLFWGLAGRQVLPAITPVLRYSKLDPEFAVHPQYPAPSVIWPWEKLDYGLRIELYRLIDLTVEYQDNTFVRRGREESNDELLVTLRLGWDKGF